MKSMIKVFIPILCFSLGCHTPSDPPQVKANSEIISIMKRVADWQLANPRHGDKDWHNGPFYAGILELHKITKDPKYIDVLMKMGERNQWKPGKRRHADDHCIGQTYLDLYLIKKDPIMLDPVRHTFDTIMKQPRKGRREWHWCDALFMAPPTLARLSTATEDKAYLDFMDDMWWDATDYLYDTEENLFFRDQRYFSRREKNGKKVFWGRGNGWVLAGLVRILQHMPEDYPQREKYVKLFREMSARIVSLQQDDGFWRASLLDPDSYPDGESSGTAFFVYSLAWGINNKLLSRKNYMPVVQKGWNALCGAVSESGKLGFVQPVGNKPVNPKKHQSETYGTGAFLLAGCEIVKLNIEEEK